MSDIEDEQLPAAGPVHCVQLDSLTLMKIIKHCRESLPELVTGQLLGLDADGVLEATNCFPFPAQNANAEGYQIAMMRCMRDVNIDHNTVGWYQSTYMGAFVNQALVETQFNYQQNIPNSVVLIYDPLKSTQGNVSMRALRLSDKFMAAYARKKFSMESLASAGLSFESIFDELPIEVRTGGLATVWLDQMVASKSAATTDTMDVLALASDPYLEKNLELMCESFDSHGQEMYRWSRYQQQLARQQQLIQNHIYRKNMENRRRVASGLDPLPIEEMPPMARPPVEPSQLDSLLLHKQISQYCHQLQQFSGAAISKLYISGELQKL